MGEEIIDLYLICSPFISEKDPPSAKITANRCGDEVQGLPGRNIFSGKLEM
jgi:hypothetical protein